MARRGETKRDDSPPRRRFNRSAGFALTGRPSRRCSRDKHEDHVVRAVRSVRRSLLASQSRAIRVIFVKLNRCLRAIDR